MNIRQRCVHCCNRSPSSLTSSSQIACLKRKMTQNNQYSPTITAILIIIIVIMLIMMLMLIMIIMINPLFKKPGRQGGEDEGSDTRPTHRYTCKPTASPSPPSSSSSPASSSIRHLTCNETHTTSQNIIIVIAITPLFHHHIHRHHHHHHNNPIPIPIPRLFPVRFF